MRRIGSVVTIGALACLGLAPALASAHPAGALDRYGCHEDKRDGTYHCHRGQYSGVTFRSKSAMLEQREAGATAADAANSDPGVRAKQESLFGPLAGERSTDQRAAAASEVVMPKGIEERLSVLEELREKDLITPEEYDQKRKEILGQL
jgi:hypothetical protein